MAGTRVRFPLFASLVTGCGEGSDPLIEEARDTLARANLVADIERTEGGFGRLNLTRETGCNLRIAVRVGPHGDEQG